MFGISLPNNVKNVLLVNSYHQGFSWTDSVTSGITSALKLHPEVKFYIENLNAKEFGQSNFENEKDHIRKKYSGIVFDGILVTDNDALDFAFKYNDCLAPNQPVVFAGISNPEDYPLEGTGFYGFKELGNTENVLDFVRKLLPNAKRVLVLTDLTTTGMIYQKDFQKQASRIGNMEVVFPKVINLDSIYAMVGDANKYDAAYYLGINLDAEGNSIDFFSVLDSINRRAKIPLFANDPVFNGIGVVGGSYQSGHKTGSEAARMLIQLMNPKFPKPAKHFFEINSDYFFDRKILDKYGISIDLTPVGSKVIHNPGFQESKYFIWIISVLFILLLVVFYLFQANRKTKKAERRISNQFNKVQNQNAELELAYQKLGEVIAELETTNTQLKESNISLETAKKRAEESDNLKSAFLANVSHEIRTPLNSIVGFSSLLSESDLNEETRNSYIELIESNSESLLVLIDEIIDLSKIEAQQLTLKFQIFSVDALMTELFRMFELSQKIKSVELRLHRISETKELFVYSDRVRVRQILINLLSNALKFTESGYIEFGYFEMEDNKIQLFVKDTGIGIKAEYQEAVFERFRKLNSDNGKVYRGTGLGLSITKKLVELLGGQITIHSEPGEGSIFFFTLEGLDLKDILQS